MTDTTPTTLEDLSPEQIAELVVAAHRPVELQRPALQPWQEQLVDRWTAHRRVASSSSDASTPDEDEITEAFMWKYIAAHRGTAVALSTARDVGYITADEWDRAVANILEEGRRCDELIAAALAEYPSNQWLPPIMLAVHLPTCGYRQRPPAPPLSEDEALAVAAFGLDRPEAAA